MLTHYTAKFMFALCINFSFNVDMFNIFLPARPKETKFSVEATEDGKVRISNLSILKKCYPQPIQVGNQDLQKGLQVYPFLQKGLKMCPF